MFILVVVAQRWSLTQVYFTVLSNSALKANVYREINFYRARKI